MLRSSHGTPRPGARPPPRREPPAGPPKARPTKQPRSAAPRTAAPAPRRDDDVAKLKKARAPGATTSTASEEAREVAIVIAVAGLEKKATGLEVIDVAGKVDYADFLVLMSGRSDRHVTALASAIEEALRKRNKRALAVEGLPHANWVLMDFGDVVVHVFQDDARATYDIDGLWMDARRVPVPLPDIPRS
jgi:ribosome-associated protein